MNAREELESLLSSKKTIYELVNFQKLHSDMILYRFVSEIEYYNRPTYTTLDKISHEILFVKQGGITTIKLADLNLNELSCINLPIIHHEFADAS